MESKSFSLIRQGYESRVIVNDRISMDPDLTLELVAKRKGIFSHFSLSRHGDAYYNLMTAEGKDDLLVNLILDDQKFSETIEIYLDVFQSRAAVED